MDSFVKITIGAWQSNPHPLLFRRFAPVRTDPNLERIAMAEAFIYGHVRTPRGRVRPDDFVYLNTRASRPIWRVNCGRNTTFPLVLFAIDAECKRNT